MLGQDMVNLMKEKARQELEDRRGVFAREIAQIKEHQAGMNAYYSGGTVQKILDAIDCEYRIRTCLIWQAFARVLSAGHAKLNADIALNVKSELAQLLDAGSEDIHGHYRGLGGIMRGFTPLKSIAESRGLAITRVDTEIDCACLERSTSSDSTPTVSNVFYQCSGIMQTGSGSISVTVVGPEERSAVAKAIEASKSAIAQDVTLDANRKNQASELISGLETQMSRPEPNRQIISGLLLGLAMTVQTLAAAPQAYQLVKGAAALFGLSLP